MNCTQQYCISWSEFHRDTRELARRLLHQADNNPPWRGIIGIARGGMIPATILARELDIRLLDSLCIASYDHDLQGDIEIIKSVSGDGEGFLLVDDLVDTGVTADVARQLLPGALFASVYAKPAGLPSAHCVAREFPQDTWLHFPWDISDDQFSEPLIHSHRSSPRD